MLITRGAMITIFLANPSRPIADFVKSLTCRFRVFPPYNYNSVQAKEVFKKTKTIKQTNKRKMKIIHFHLVSQSVKSSPASFWIQSGFCLLVCGGSLESDEQSDSRVNNPGVQNGDLCSDQRLLILVDE